MIVALIRRVVTWEVAGDFNLWPYIARKYGDYLIQSLHLACGLISIHDVDADVLIFPPSFQVASESSESSGQSLKGVGAGGRNRCRWL